MKNYFLVLLGSFLFLSTASFAQTKNKKGKNAATDNYNSLLWEISGNGLKKSSYLYGTIHIIGESDFFMTDATKKKFSKTKQLALEIDMDDPMLMFKSMMGIMMKGGVTLEDLMTEEEYKKVTAHFGDMGLPMPMLKRMKPMLISSMAMEQTNQDAMKSYEMVFMKMAKKEEMEILGLESVEYQISVLDSIPYEEQAKMLLESLEGEGDLGEESFDEMVKLYKAQDLEGLNKLIQGEDSDLTGFNDMLLKNRNENWIPVIGEMASTKPTFFAVGAGHLPGEFGVINLLKEAGYTVKPIR